MTAAAAQFIAQLDARLGKPYSETIDGGVGPDYYDCIAEGSMVVTDVGEVPIEHVQPGDRVLTRNGFQRVTRAWKVRSDAETIGVRFSNGRTLRGTPDHNVWTENRGWVALGEVTLFDTLVLWESGVRAEPHRSQSSTVSSTTGIPTRRSGHTGLTSSGWESFSTGSFGRSTTDQSLTDSTCITLTATPSTTSPKTSNASRVPTTNRSVLEAESDTNISAQSAASGSRRSKRPSRPFGIAMCDASGLPSIESTKKRGDGSPPPPSNSHAQSAGRPSSAHSGRGRVPGFAVGHVSTIGSEDAPRPSTEAVYDLTVENAHEFFANGVLVHNCSGLVEVCLNAIGIPYTRTTYSQWADERYQHFGPFVFGQALPPLEIGDVLYMHVDGEADPGHVGVYDGSGVYIDAPHTGAFVRIETIPNTPGEHVYGIIRPPFGSSPPPPPPPPTRQESDMSWFASDPKTGGVWATDPNGDLYPTGGAPFVEALSQHPEYHAGAAESIDSNPCVGIAYWAAFGNDGIMFFTQPPVGEGGWDGTTTPGAVPYDIYRFLRNGSPA